MDDGGSDFYERRGCVCRGRRRGRLLSPGDHGGRFRLHGGTRRGTLVGEQRSSLVAVSRRKLASWRLDWGHPFRWVRRSQLALRLSQTSRDYIRNLVHVDERGLRIASPPIVGESSGRDPMAPRGRSAASELPLQL